VFLTGGVDVDPANYGESRKPCCGHTDPPRDGTELALVRWALADHKPVLGVCRGVQLLNVALGGTLFQDVKGELPASIKHDYFPTPAEPRRDRLVHGVLVTEGSRLRGILGEGEVQVNSMHHQGIKELAPGLVANAFAPDGLIEGVEQANGHFLVGVQWHPEELAETSPAMRRLFAAFVQAAAERRGSSAPVG
jgi:putative glutamine amidotransferase